MTKEQRLKILKPLLAAVIAAVSLTTIICIQVERKKRFHTYAGSTIKCVLDIRQHNDTTKGLVSGYNYALLKKFAESVGSEAEIALAEEDENSLDSLRAGSVDIVVLPNPSEHDLEGLGVSIPEDSLTMWVSASIRCAPEIDAWMKEFPQTEGFQDMKESFLRVLFNPGRVAELGRKVRHISPYDDLFREAVSALQWDDWRKFAAIVFHESKFRIDVRSAKGAAGLMQMMPRTADRFGVENAIDPAQSVKAGAEYLRTLQGIFRKYARTDELFHFTMAAYNAGEGNILKCIRYADSLGVYDSTWTCIREIMPVMARDSVTGPGNFRYRETIYYVDCIDSLSRAFAAISDL